ncbi:hypoxia up-regulated protein 1 [Teleopsis dalmanni]|uniref:hypoxia up-regulated protein 1 n=1 Tax=Teleopsis dalmanni TaxID=139649 RepID=UPI0018CF91B8|nr:hypoxia up-regulated protein 1 [Teleopsis dalmanni]
MIIVERFGRHSPVPFVTILFVFAISFINLVPHGVNSAAVMSVDLGTEWMKVGVVSPGVPMEIALNKESKRKTPTILSFRDGVRNFGEDAVTVGLREPAAVYGYLLDLLGKTVDNPIVDLYKKRFPYYNITADPQRQTVIFTKNNNEQFSVEELVAQMLQKAKEFAEESTRQIVTECVLIVPGYFGQAEREALLSAAHLANLKVLQLLNDYTAVALNYGVFHRAEINETAQYYIFYDMGAYKTSAALVSYSLIKDKQTKEINPLIQVLGVGYDRNLGGLEIQMRLRDYLASEFNAMKKTKTDVTKNPRALAKLFKEAGRLKNVLSANLDHYAQIEGLLEDHDFKLQVTREKLEELCLSLWPRVTNPIQSALTVSGLSMDVVSQVIIFGGGTRVPKVQDIIKNYIKQELGKSLNADEAATMGAVYKAADIATGFKVKKFIIKDAVVFPIHITFQRDPGDGTEVKQVKRVLFGNMNSYPQKKVITFNKHTDDFDFYASYGDLSHFSKEEIANIGSLNISKVELLKIKQIIEKNQKDVVETKGIKAYFLLDDSGVFRCTGVEFVYEKHKIENEEEGTLAKLGSTISKLFSKDGSKKKDMDTLEENKENDEPMDQKPDNEEPMQKDYKPNDKANKTEESQKEETNNSDFKNDTVKIIVVKEPVEHNINVLFTIPLAGTALKTSTEKLNAINEIERERNRLASVFNELESHVIETQQKLSEAEFSSCISEDEKEKILSECIAISDWLYEDDNRKPSSYEERLIELKKLTNIFLSRHWEHEERPEALKALEGMIDAASKFLTSAKNLTKETNPEKDIFTQVEIDTLTNVIDETTKWKKTETQIQESLQRHEEIRLTVKDITDKMSLLDREVKYLVNKLKIWKPKQQPQKSDKNTDDESEDETSDTHKETTESGSGKQTTHNPSNNEGEQGTDSTKHADKENVTESTPSKKETPRSDL